MDRRSWLYSMVAIGLSGCIQWPSQPAEHEITNFDVVYDGVLIIRDGMHVNDVQAVLGQSYCGWSFGPVIRDNRDYPDGLCVTYDGVRVSGVRLLETTTWGPGQRPSKSDEELQSILRPGMSHREVARLIGQPKCGFVEPRGTRSVTLVYPQPGIAIIFVDDKLIRWWRTHFYADKPIEGAEQ